MRQPIKRGKMMAEINITPFTDVVLVLLIIFMITTPMLSQPGIKVKLPKAVSAETDSEKNITITIDPDGNIFLDKRQVNIDQLKSRITARLTNTPDAPVVVNGDRTVKYDAVIKVIDVARQSGAKRFSLGVELESLPASGPQVSE